MPQSIPQTLRRFSRRLPRLPILDFTLGMLAATHVVVWLSCFAATWGASLAVVVALATSFGLALLLSDRLSRGDGNLSGAGSWLFVAGWTLALPGLLSLSMESIRWLPFDVAQQPFGTFTVILAAAMLLTGPGWFALLTSAIRARTGSSTFPLVSPWTLAGAAVWLYLMPMTLAVWIGLQGISWTVSGITLLVAAMLWRTQQRAKQFGVSEPVVAPATSSPASGTWRPVAGDLLAGLSAGIALAVAVRITGQLMVNSAYVACSQLAGLTGGLAIGVWLRRRRQHSTVEAPFAESLVSAYAVAALVVLYPQLTTMALWISANVSHTLSILLLRGGMLALCLLPPGISLGLRLTSRSAADRNRIAAASLRTPTVAALAFAVARVIDVPVSAGLALTVAAACTAFAFGWRRPLRIPTRRRLAVSVVLTLPLTIGVFAVSRFDAHRSAKVLYSAQAVQAYRAGTPADQLHLIDDGRLIGSLQRDGSTWSAWMHAGHQVVVRENGMPRGIHSLDTRLCPHMPTELLPSVFPLIMHPAPRQVTLVGTGGSTALAGCLAFPVSQVTCIEPDRGLLALTAQCCAGHAPRNPFDDSRLRVICTEPVIAAARQQPPQDVIILNRPQAVLWDASAEFTTEYYRRLADHLAPGGLLCQRLYYGDFGAGPIRDMAATLRKVFPQVILIETGPGELVFIAGRDRQAMVGPGLFQRASRPHVRALVSQLGWDWSVMMTAATVDAADIDDLVDAEAALVNSTVSGRFTCRLPVELARWGDKHQEVQELLGPHGTQLCRLLENEAEMQDLALRLADVAERQRITEDHPDVFWAYRDTLRRRLQERPRMTIQQVGYDGLDRDLHPEDARRKEYLLALNDAATQEKPDARSLNRLARFIEPHDPLVSYFVHQELAELYARADVPDPDAELTHRLHSVFYASGRDRSVRNVTDAIELIIAQPRALPDPQRRWDVLNALLEVLMRRWQLRSVSEGTSRYEAVDASHSIDAAQNALDAMDALAPETAISPQDWEIRRSLLERHLVGPLRNHRSGQRT